MNLCSQAVAWHLSTSHGRGLSHWISCHVWFSFTRALTDRSFRVVPAVVMLTECCRAMPRITKAEVVARFPRSLLARPQHLGMRRDRHPRFLTQGDAIWVTTVTGADCGAAPYDHLAVHYRFVSGHDTTFFRQTWRSCVPWRRIGAEASSETSVPVTPAWGGDFVSLPSTAHAR